MAILKAESQGEMQDFLPLTINTRGTDNSDEKTKPNRKPCYREEDEDEEEEQVVQVFDPVNYLNMIPRKK